MSVKLNLIALVSGDDVFTGFTLYTVTTAYIFAFASLENFTCLGDMTATTAEIFTAFVTSAAAITLPGKIISIIILSGGCQD